VNPTASQLRGSAGSGRYPVRLGASGVDVAPEDGDAERLPYRTPTFDIVVSAFGVMFAPDQRAAAAELARVTRSGGRLALLNWHPARGVADFFKVMAPYMPPAPEGAGNPFAWGDCDRLFELLGDAFQLRYEDGDCPQPGSSAEQVWELFTTAFGPTKTLADSLDPELRGAAARLDRLLRPVPKRRRRQQPRP
jgi:SAM-dependent methyltransferase